MTLSKANNSTKEDNPDLKEIRVSNFFMRNPSMKFQNPILNLKQFLIYEFDVTKFAKGDKSIKLNDFF